MTATTADVLAGRAPYALHEGDALAWLPTLPAGCVDAVVTDPPYNVGFSYANGTDKRADYRGWCDSWLAECLRVSTGPVAISCGIVNLAMWCGIRPPSWVLCWWKPACMGRSAVGFNNWEPVLLYGKSRGEGGADVIRAPIIPGNDMSGHPCPKPVEWGRGLIRRLTREGDTVLDLFAGSGTTGVACVQTGRRFLGCELDPAYHAVAVKRLAEANCETGLFAPRPEPTLFGGTP
jgi:adenine-specific DNA-methyltransferase